MIRMKGELTRPTSLTKRYENITDLMTLQDQIESFQKLIFVNFRGSNNNECRISALVPLVKESFGIYKFITSMLRAMHRSEPHSKEHHNANVQGRRAKRLYYRFENGITHSTIIYDASTTNVQI